MKTTASYSVISTIIVSLLSSGGVSAQPPSHANIPETARGVYKKFNIDDDGNADIELYDVGPSMQCKMKNVRGNGGGKYCTSDLTSVTLVDAPCSPLDNIFRGNGNGCFVASYVDADEGKIYHIDSGGVVTETSSADYPDEEDPEDLEEAEGAGGRRSLLRGPTKNSLGINLNSAVDTDTDTTERNLQSNPVEIDVLVVYTDFARRQNCGSCTDPESEQAMIDRVNLAFAETNQAYADSGVNAVINLVKLHRDTSGYNIDETDTSSMSPSLTALRSTNDGNLDYVHQLRIDVGADMVALITGGAGCGIAYLNSSPSYGYMFSVTKWSCATGYYSFGHELGE